MIVLLASYPRSGNTFFRTVAHAAFGVKSADIHDPEATPREDEREKEVNSLIGHTGVARIDAGSALALLKTHHLADASDTRPAICLLRDGRDAYVSYAHFALAYFQEQMPGSDFLAALRMLVQSPDHFGGWSRNVESWLARSAPTTFVRYEELIVDPAQCVRDAAAALGISLDRTDQAVPAFEKLRDLMPAVFRKGVAGSWREEMPADIEELFWKHHGGTMERLGYAR